MITDGFIWHFKFSAWTKMHQSCDHVNSKKSIFLNPVLINKPQLKNHQDLVPRFHLNMILMSLILHFIVKILKLQRDNGIKPFYMTENIKWHLFRICIQVQVYISSCNEDDEFLYCPDAVIAVPAGLPWWIWLILVLFILLLGICVILLSLSLNNALLDTDLTRSHAKCWICCEINRIFIF